MDIINLTDFFCSSDSKVVLCKQKNPCNEERKQVFSLFLMSLLSGLIKSENLPDLVIKKQDTVPQNQCELIKSLPVLKDFEK